MLRAGTVGAGVVLAAGVPGVALAARQRPVLTHGVQTGDVTTDGAIVWTRADRPSRMLVEVGYESLPAVANANRAFDPSRPPIWPDAKSNILRRASRVHGDVDAAFASADRVILERFAQTRHANQPMETRGSVAEWLPATESIRFHTSHQSVHALRWGLVPSWAKQPATGLKMINARV